jgi:hypothetical protein
VREEDFPRTVCGRLFTREELDLIRRIISGNPPATRMQISREVCAALSWLKPDGGLKEMSCRVALLKLHRAGIIQLPPPRFPHNNGRRMKRRTPQGEPRALINKELQELLPLELRRVTTKKELYFWNELIDRYHYLGYTPLPGAQVRYLVYSPLGCLGALGFSAAAWKVKPRDAWIGWSSLQREKNLHLIVNNSRFLILPWVQVKNLASKALSLCVQKLPEDWEKTYGYRPVLLETFVERDRFAGTCYRAANWILVGSTQGRGKLDRFMEYKLPVKDIYLYPLAKNFRDILLGLSPQ